MPKSKKLWFFYSLTALNRGLGIIYGLPVVFDLDLYGGHNMFSSNKFAWPVVFDLDLYGRHNRIVSSVSRVRCAKYLID